MATKSKTAKIDYQPADRSLALDLPAGLPSAGKIEKYLASVATYEQKLADVVDRRNTLLAQAKATQLGVLMQTADELSAELEALSTERHGLRGQKCALLAEVAPEIGVLVDEAQKGLDAAIAAERSRLAAMGAGPEAMEVYGSNPKSAERLFEQKLRDADECLVARGRLNRLRSMHNAAEAIGNATAGEVEPLRWPDVTGEPEKIARFIGLDRQQRPRFQFAVSEV